MRKVYKPFDMKNHHNVYTLGQAWQVYTGNDVTYRPLAMPGLLRALSQKW